MGNKTEWICTHCYDASPCHLESNGNPKRCVIGGANVKWNMNIKPDEWYYSKISKVIQRWQSTFKMDSNIVKLSPELQAAIDKEVGE